MKEYDSNVVTQHELYINQLEKGPFVFLYRPNMGLKALPLTGTIFIKHRKFIQSLGSSGALKRMIMTGHTCIARCQVSATLSTDKNLCLIYEKFNRRWAVVLPMHMLINVHTLQVQRIGLTYGLQFCVFFKHNNIPVSCNM